MSMHTYIGIMAIKAEPGTNEKGEEGYFTVSSDKGARVWVPKDRFDKIYLGLDTEDKKVNQEDVDKLVAKWLFRRLDKRTILGVAILKSGFRVYATAGSVDPQPTDTNPGVILCKERLHAKIWSYVGFVSQWAFKGLHHTDLESPIYTDITDLESMDF